MNATITLTNKLRGVASMSNAIINGGASPYPKHVGPAAICSFSDGAQDAPLKSLVFSIEPQQSGSGDPSPSNIRPISGWSQVDGKQSGGNLLNYDAWKTVSIVHGTGVFENNGVTLTATAGDCYTSFNTSGGYSADAQIPVKVGEPITLSWDTPDTAVAAQVYIFPNGSTTGLVSAPAVNKKLTYTPTAGITYVTFRLGVTTNGTTVHYKNLMANFGTAAAAYTPFTGKRAITIALGQTVYGGYEDALAGKMVTTGVAVDMGTLSWEAGTDSVGQYFKANLSPLAKKRSGNLLEGAICAMYPQMPTNNVTDKSFAISVTGSPIYVRDTSYNTAAAFKTAMSGIKVFYPIESPTETDLTPVNVSSLLGQNNIWCNTGDTELDYYPAAASVVAVLNRSSKVYTSIPLGKIRYDTYQTTPNQALDLDSYRAETGVLIRNVLSHTATKIEFNTPSMTNLQWEEVWNIIKAGFNNSTERKLKLKYYDQMSATYKTGWFYVPDVQFTIRNIDEANGIINYDEVRVAFIEY